MSDAATATPPKVGGWYVAAFLVLLVTVIAVTTFYPQLPEGRSGVEVLFSVLIGPVVVIGSAAVASRLLRSASAPAPGVDDISQTRKAGIYSLTRRNLAWYQLVLAACVAVVSVWSVHPAGGSPPTGWFWAVVGVSTVALVAATVLGERRLNRVADEESGTANPLKWGLVYWDPSDKRVLIPWDDWNMRFNWGYPLTWIAVFLLFGFISIPAVLLLVFA